MPKPFTKVYINDQIILIMKLPILAITMGDPAGIGPEIVVRALNHKETYNQCRPIVTGEGLGCCLHIHADQFPGKGLF